MNVAVVDDEKIIREHLQNLIERCRPDCRTEGFASGEELLAARKQFEIVFLDIRMDGLDGMETAKKLRERSKDGLQEKTVLIFVTGIREYALEAFDVAAFHYLLKPVEEKKLSEVLERAVREVEKRKGCRQGQLVFKTRNRSVTLQPEQILYLENRGRKLVIHTAGTAGDKAIEIYAAMGGLEEQLGGSFYRCHRGYLVNMAYISEYDSESITLSNGETVYLAKGRYHGFVKAYMYYLKNGGRVLV